MAAAKQPRVSNQAIIEQLQRLERELATLRDERQTSTRAEGARSSTSATDLAHALKGTLDEISRSCASMDNPISDFAVREFSIQANVVMDIDAFGRADYRFMRPDEQIDERALTRVALTFVPVPKPTPQGQVFARGDAIDIEAIDGIGDVTRVQLNQRGIYSVADLLRTSTRVRNRVELSALLGVERNKLANWLEQAELMAVEGVGEQAAKLLRHAGVSSLEQLADQQPESLASIIEQKLGAEAARQLGKPTEQLRKWIDTARASRGLAPLISKVTPARFAVVLQDAGEQPEDVFALLRDLHDDESLARNIVAALPAVIIQHVDELAARELAKQFEQRGAKVSIEPVD